MALNLPENLWESPVIRNRLLQEACFECDYGFSEKKQYWMVVPFADSAAGAVILRNYEDKLENCDPHDIQVDFALKLREKLQYEAHFDGVWGVGFTHPPTNYEVLTDTQNCWNRLIMIWFDGDGDPQYTLESDRPFIDLIRDDPFYWVEQAHTAHKAYNEEYGQKALKSDMSIKEDQQTKAALAALK